MIMAEKVPIVIVDPEDYKNILLKLNDIDEKIEFTNSEIHQRYGKKIGRDIGILYGICTALMIVVVYLLLLLSPVLPRLQSFLQSVLFK